MGKKSDIKKNMLTEMSDAEFLSFLYSEREREESLNSYQGWNLWAAVGAMVTVACAAYGIICAHMGEIDRLRTLYLVSLGLGTIFCYWYSVVFYFSFLERKRAKDFKRIKHLKDVAPMPYLIVTTVCSVEFALGFLFVECDNRWNVVSISWIVLAVFHLLVCVNLYINWNAIVWAVKEDILFAKTWVMVVVGLSVYLLFWMIWKWSRENIAGPYFGTSEFELAACNIAFVMLVYLFLKIKIKNRKSSEIDVLIDEYLYKGKSKEDVYYQLRANQMGYGVLEACSQEFCALKKYSDDFDSKKKALEELKASFENGTIGLDSVVEKFESLKGLFEFNDEWARRVDVLFDKLDEIARNVPKLKDEEEFKNLFDIVGWMMKRSRVMTDVIKLVTENFEKLINEHCDMGKE